MLCCAIDRIDREGVMYQFRLCVCVCLYICLHLHFGSNNLHWGNYSECHLQAWIIPLFLLTGLIKSSCQGHSVSLPTSDVTLATVMEGAVSS